MKKYCIYLSVIMLVIGCGRGNELVNSLGCKTKRLETTKIKTDFRKNFKIKVPKHWKTQLYYDAQTSEIYIADTTKQLSKTFILSSSYVNDKLVIDSTFVNLYIKKQKKQQLHFVRGKLFTYKNKPAYWSIFKGTKNNRNFHQFVFFVKTSDNTYFTVNTDIYGNKDVEKRICESVSIIKEITFL